jgi:hypothetical protein
VISATSFKPLKLQSRENNILKLFLIVLDGEADCYLADPAACDPVNLDGVILFTDEHLLFQKCRKNWEMLF